MLAADRRAWDHADRAGDWPPVFAVPRSASSAKIAEDHTIGNLAAVAGLLRAAPRRHLDGRPDRSADTGLRDLRAGDRYLLCSDGLSPVADDRPHFYVLNFARRIRRRAGQLAVLAGAGPACPG